MQGGLAELYSDNLGQEVKKGLHERKAQGLYNGLLPFGATKREDGVPMPHPGTLQGLEMAFQLAANGQSDREVARALNSAGYRTAGNQGTRLFSKDTVRGILTNRFYVGQLPGRESGWVDGRHAPLIPIETFDAAESARARNRHNPAKTTRSDSRVSSLSGVAKCYECGATLRTMRNRGVARMVCNTRLKRGACTQKSARLDGYESELQHYFDAFTIPEDYQQKLLDGQRRLVAAHDDTEAQRSRLHGALDRLKDLYKWGDKTKSEYQRETDEILEELQMLRAAPVDDSAAMDKLAEFLRDVSSAWRVADQERRNKLARLLFDGVWIKDQAVLGVTPRPELKPFFDLQYAGLSNDVLQWRPQSSEDRNNNYLRTLFMN